MHRDLGICLGGIGWYGSVSFFSSPDPQGLAALGWESGRCDAAALAVLVRGLINTWELPSQCNTF